jgi:ATP-binding cassette, subfamily F, member 3
MLAIDALTYDAWGRRFFDEASVTLAPGMKAGLVGRNGAGKSTLFKLILGELQPTGGDIRMPKAWRVATVDQEVAASPVLLLDAVLALDVRRARLMAELETAAPERQGELHADLYAIDAERAPARAAEILSGLGFTQGDLGRPMSDFSGGWRMRATLAGALLAEPDLLLLDEPTNYLDLEGALWLENRLKRYPAAALVISHDRELLNNSVGNIIHLRPTPSGGKLDLYTGGYDQFERQKAEKERLQAASNVKIEAQRAHLQSFVDRFRAKASKAVQAQSRLKMLAKLPPVVSAIEEHVAPFRLPSPKQPLSPPVVRMEGASVGYEDRTILRNLNLRLDLDDRIGLLGINGAGKSTFAKLLAGALKESHGEVWRDRRLKVGWFHQHQIEALDPRETAVDIIRRSRPEMGEAQRRAVLGSFGFSASRAETQALDLSGGERARLLLNMVAMDAPHLLILDEPTNHLDIDSRRALLDALNDYEGAVVLITHDRSLMELVADRLWLTADGTVRPYDGDMDDYARLVLDRSREAARAEAGPKAVVVDRKEARKASAEARARIAPLKKTADALEAKIEKLTRLIAVQNEQLEDETLPPAKVIDIGREQARAEKALAQAEAEWLEAAEAYEAAKTEAGL